MFAKSKVDDYL